MLIKIRKISKKEKVPYRCFNIVNSKPIEIIDYIKMISKILNKKVRIKYIGIQKGDVEKTHGSKSLIKKNIGPIKQTSLENGLKKYLLWFKKYYFYLK